MVLDNQNRPAGGLPEYHERIEAGATEDKGEVAGGEGISDEAGLRRGRGDSEFAGSRDPGADEWARGDDKWVLWCPGINMRRGEVKEKPGSQAGAAEK